MKKKKLHIRYARCVVIVDVVSREKPHLRNNCRFKKEPKGADEPQQEQPEDEPQAEARNLRLLTVDIGKKPGKGEDAPPLCTSDGTLHTTGVFDGMGGSGATEYTTDEGTHTGAYIASRIARQATADFSGKLGDCTFNPEELSALLKQALDTYAEEHGIRPSGLRSSIIRILPTTLAMVCARSEGGKTRVVSYWCGDSRNYLLTRSGLRQISRDHLSKTQDPLENLRNDESLSNCVCQDKPFHIEAYDAGEYDEPVIILSATDGCFGYLKTPMHFEHLLLRTLADSSDMEDWQKRIEDRLRPISGDDFSLSLCMTGGDYGYWKEALRERLETLESKYIRPLEGDENMKGASGYAPEPERRGSGSSEGIEQTSPEGGCYEDDALRADERPMSYDDMVDAMWAEYKKQFMKIDETA